MADQTWGGGSGDEGLTGLEPDRYDLVVPDGATAGAVLLHPHPDYGGDRHNNMVDALFRRLPQSGIAVVRFDFASADLTTGALDAMAAIDLLPTEEVAVVGYSFGALVAGDVVDPRVTTWILIAPPLGARTPSAAGRTRPKLVLAADRDQFCSLDDVVAIAGTWKTTTIERIRGADHFLGGATAGVAEQVVAWITEGELPE